MSESLLNFLDYYIAKDEDMLQTIYNSLKQESRPSITENLIQDMNYFQGHLDALKKVYNKVRYNEEP